MTIAVANSALSNSMMYLITRVNELADAMSNKVVTVASNTTTGNAVVNGYITSTGFIANSLAITSASYSINATTISWPNIEANSLSANSVSFASFSAITLGSNVATINTATIVALTSNSTAVFANATVNNFTVTTATVTTANIATLKATTGNVVTLTGNSVSYTFTTLANVTWGSSVFVPPNVTTANGSYYLNGNGSWSIVTSGANVSSVNTAVQYANNGGLGGNGSFAYDYTTSTLSLTNAVSLGEVLSMGLYINTASTSQQALDSFTLASYRSGEYVISMKDNTANNFQLSRIGIIQSGGVCTITEYATLITNSAVASFDATVNTTHAILRVTPVTANVSYRIAKTLLPV